MKWIKNGNQLINMAHVSTVDIETDEGYEYYLCFKRKDSRQLTTKKYKSIEEVEKQLDHIAIFLEHSNSTIMAMAPTNEEEL